MSASPCVYLRTKSSKNISLNFLPDVRSAEELLHEHKVKQQLALLSTTATVLAKVSLRSEGRLRWTLLTRGNVKWRDAEV